MIRYSRESYLFFKRVLDLFGAVSLLVVLLPLFLLITAFQLLMHGPPVFFLHLRPGLHGVPFEVVKFRTMRIAGEADEGSVGSSQVTALGRFLRSTSLDELPQLINVLKGEMSFVGPRPLLIEYLQHYSEAQMARHDVRPGLTGLAQINGRKSLTLEEKVGLDLTYVQEVSLALDVRILLLTIRVVLSRRNAL